MIDIVGYEYRPCLSCLRRSYRRSIWRDHSDHIHWCVIQVCTSKSVFQLPDAGSDPLSCPEFVGQLNLCDL